MIFMVYSSINKMGGFIINKVIKNVRNKTVKYRLARSHPSPHKEKIREKKIQKTKCEIFLGLSLEDSRDVFDKLQSAMGYTNKTQI